MRKWICNLSAMVLALTMAVTVIVPAFAKSEKRALTEEDKAAIDAFSEKFSTTVGNSLEKFLAGDTQGAADLLESNLLQGTGLNDFYDDIVDSEDVVDKTSRANVKKAGSKIKKTNKSQSGSTNGYKRLLYFRNSNVNYSRPKKNSLKLFPTAIWYTDDGEMHVMLNVINGYTKAFYLDKIDYVLIKDSNGTVVAEGYPTAFKKDVELGRYISESDHDENQDYVILKFKKGTFNPNLYKVNLLSLNLSFQYSGYLGNSTSKTKKSGTSSDASQMADSLWESYVDWVDENSGNRKSMTAITEDFAKELAELTTEYYKAMLAIYSVDGTFTGNFVDFTNTVITAYSNFLSGKTDVATLILDLEKASSVWLLANMSTGSNVITTAVPATFETLSYGMSLFFAGAKYGVRMTGAAACDVIEVWAFINMFRWLPFVLP